MANDEPATALPWWPSSDARRAALATSRRARRAERPAERAGRTRGRTTLDAILEAALRILDSEGLDALTVRRLAAELGVGPMTIYSYVRDKDDLLDLIVDRATAEIAPPPPGGDWQAQARALAHNLRTTLLAHPAGIRLISERPMRGPNAFRLLEAGLGIFREAGFSDEQATHAYFALGNYVLGAVLAESTAIGLEPRSAAGAGGAANLSASTVRQLPAGRYPNITALAAYIYDEPPTPSATDRSPGAAAPSPRFDFGLESLIRGISAMPMGPKRR